MLQLVLETAMCSLSDINGVGNMQIDPTSYFAYWGKANLDNSDAAQFHLLPFHCLDVAAVGVAYLRQSEALLDAFCTMLDCSKEDFLSWASFILALHDLGKLSEAFQSQRSDLIELLKKRAPNRVMQYSERHDSLGFWLWKDEIGSVVSRQLGLDCSRVGQESLRCWMRAVTGHHGMPPKSAGSVDRFFLPADKKVAIDFVLSMGQLLLTEGAKKIGQRG
jgi:CRISPR-associated endonuclease/helicase Cas3